MEHSQAIMQDAGRAVEGSSKPTASTHDTSNNGNVASTGDDGQNDDQRNVKKRKAEFQNKRMHHGSRGGRGGRGRGRDRDDGGRDKKRDMGRGQYFRDEPDKRQKTQDSREKREREGNTAIYHTEFSKDEISAEDRRPKKKVAVLIGYSGTGYKGMQISGHERTIEGDLFKAFVDAGAISKANADDPKKSALVRCARTDKGVHAAGNMISLKLIIEDKDVVEKINNHLSPQIRVWGIERTTNSFSCYQSCDSRWYEYLIPSHAFLPPHPSSWMAKKLEALADEANDREGYESRQAEVRNFWKDVDDKVIAPILESIDADIRWEVVKALQGEEEANAKTTNIDADHDDAVQSGGASDEPISETKLEDPACIIKPTKEVKPEDPKVGDDAAKDANPAVGAKPQLTPAELDRLTRLRAATKQLRNAYSKAKRHYRIPSERIDRVQAALSKYVGTSNYHNYTVQKKFKDPSAQRHIKSFVVNRKPILIGDGPDEEKSEWLSLKVHGQSFMMHQIRKMIGMLTLVVRSGSDLATLEDSVKEPKYSIPKVPGLGLLLERPVFDSYNKSQAKSFDREPLLFSKYEKEIEAFKQREIYERIFREEEERNEFSRFFNHLDNFKEPYFLYVSSMGLEATKTDDKKPASFSELDGSDGEGDANGNDG
ncbi:Hypothetical protein R9X50_00652300 [Acrodontium crateriforme]|uniref:tRNA pseudouridine synthase 1 n=1 Tax=Acrodontium crateriforme TaxID=150365 RepID=A0AAQ3M9A8_9PEZI|nr:Hypothetical protein R9X50_00652300 [Acrodontium crateriforme]